MSVYQELVDFDYEFSVQKAKPTIINDLMTSSEEDKQRLKALIQKNYSADLLSNLPSCDCGAIVGEYNIGKYCQLCDTHVVAPLDSQIEPILWMRAPNGVAPLLNPVVFLILNEKFKKSSFEIIQYLINGNYRTVSKIPTIVDDMARVGIERGYNYFINNFDAIIQYLCDHPDFRKDNDNEKLKLFLKTYRNCIFSNYLPLPNKSLLVIEETSTGTYVDPIIVGAIDALQTIAGIDQNDILQNQRVKENRTAKTLIELALFYDNFYRATFSGKPGVFRKHVFGTRSHFSFRAVISSITDVHTYDEIHIPWSVAVAVFRIHLFNRLHRMGYKPNDAIKLINEHSYRYHPLLDQLFNEFIHTSKEGGVVCALNRNPSLHLASIQKVRITKVKTNVRDLTLGMSILIVTGFNADFDGDALNCMLSVDNELGDAFENLAPHRSGLSMDKPHEISGNLSMPKPVIATISNWIHDKATYPATREQLEFMATLANMS